MKQSGMRGFVAPIIPDSASLHPGYAGCLHHFRRGNKTVIERYLEQSPPAADSLEMTLLQAMTQVRFSVFRVMDITPLQKAVLMDLVQGDLFQAMIAEFGKPGAVVNMKQQCVEGDYAYILWAAETADNVYEMGTDTFVVRDGKIVVQSFAGKITPKS